MDQIVLQSTTKKCVKHSQKKIKFVQVNDVSNSQDNHFFYCTTCINKDLTFKGINYLLISQIIDEGHQNIIQKWPPVNDYSVLDKLIQHTEEQNSITSVVHQINRYFTQLKEEFLRKVDICEKKMINHALELPLGKESILKQYQDISQINMLRSLLIEGEKKDSEAFEKNYKQFMTKIESNKEQNSELFSKLLQQCNQKQQLVNFEYPNLIKDSIFSFIDQIDFFNNSNPNGNSSQYRNEISQESKASKIMKLISNKSNFCSSDFISQLEQLLEKINPLLSNIQFENMHQSNKNPIDFSALSEQKFDLMKDLIDHQIQLEKNRELASSIKNTIQYQYLEGILDSSVNFVNNNLKEQLKLYFMDSYPLLKQVNFTNAIGDNHRFDSFKSLSDTEIEDIISLMNKRKMLALDDQFNSSQTKLVQDKALILSRIFEDVKVTMRKYPIFDLMKKIQNTQLEVKLTKTNFNVGNSFLDIEQDNQVTLIQQSSGYLNCVSNIILEKEKKYIFRFSIQNPNNKFFYLGLIRNSQCESSEGFKNNMSCLFETKNSVIQLRGGAGIDKHIKGDRIKLNQEIDIEMRVWLGNKQLEILDFSNYQYQVELKEEFKSKLIEYDDLKLYIGIQDLGLKVMLKSAFEVGDFPN